MNGSVRRFVYQYNGDERSRDIEEDLGGVMETPAIGSMIERHDTHWRVVHVIAPVAPNGTIPVVRIFLNDTARMKARAVSAKRDAPAQHELV